MGAEIRWDSQSGRGRGIRRALVFVLALALLAGGCGESDSTTSESEKAADVEFLNEALARELTSLEAYESGMPLLRGQFRVIGREFVAHDQEHIDALTKAVRGLGGETDAEAGEPESPRPRNQAEFLTLAYDRENAALASYLDAAPLLATAAPRTLAAALTASHAQRLVVLRQGLGVPLAVAVSEAFEPGDLPPPDKEPPQEPKQEEPRR